ncbi:MAG TPA: BBP7 family outer membrane beta-barrel protein, partial [Gemmataceae bacterium]|nr:BBP7 family outer membrane beta-barrel protein [Gemmataceae bacterium]
PPVLAATGPLGPGSRVLFGSTDRGYDAFNGLFFGGGFWLDRQHNFGLGVSGFWTEKQSTSTVIGSDATGSPAIARPFFNPQLVGLGGQDAIFVSSPGRSAGTLTVDTEAQLGGGEVNGFLNLTNTRSCTTVMVLGFRYFDLEESLFISQVTRGLNGNTIPFFGNLAGVSAVTVSDLFQTRNQFYGGQAGLETEYRMGAVFLDAGVKVGLGPVHQVTEVSGQTLGPDGTGGSGGVLAVGASPIGNIGRTTTNRFAILSDVHGMLGVQIFDRVRVGVGYQFLYLSNVARPGSQIVTTIDPRLIPITTSFGGRIPTSPRGVPPLTPFDRDDFFMHGVQFLLEFHF